MFENLKSFFKYNRNRLISFGNFVYFSINCKSRITVFLAGITSVISITENVDMYAVMQCSWGVSVFHGLQIFKFCEQQIMFRYIDTCSLYRASGGENYVHNRGRLAKVPTRRDPSCAILYVCI